MTRVINFNAGPAALPLLALERAQRELVDFAGSGMSIMEHSHRGKEYEAVHNEAIALMRELLGVPSTHEILFVQGGASQQFATVPMNFLPRDRSGDYVVNGAWGEKAVGEATVVAALQGGSVRVAATTGVPAPDGGKEKGYTRVPTQAEIHIGPEVAYLHYTSNETIHGVQFAPGRGAQLPDTGSTPCICDMSSDFLWRKVDVSKFALIYAGAQKNIGPSGVVVVIAAKDFIAQGRKDIPKIFQYRTASENNSLYNTPPTFGIYLIRNVLDWVKSVGGLEQIEAWNREKAEKLYAAIDGRKDFYRCPVEAGSRSVMNIVFRLPTEALEDQFVAEAKKQKMIGLKGHRSVGGIRVSAYNAVSVEHITTLTSFMADFATKHG
jgi:phosphoserine aminotransferase